MILCEQDHKQVIAAADVSVTPTNFWIALPDQRGGLVSSQTPEPGHTGCSRCEDMVDGYAAPTTSVLGHVQMLRGERTRWKLEAAPTVIP